jgi:hypothetical protein
MFSPSLIFILILRVCDSEKKIIKIYLNQFKTMKNFIKDKRDV